MSGRASAEEVERLRAALERRLGIALGGAKLPLLAELVERRALASGESRSDYLDRIEAPAVDRDELRALVGEVTVGETYFFRHAEQLRAFAEFAFREPRAGALRVLSVGCASGEEPYSIAILAREDPIARGWNVSIRAIDANAALLERARLGRYSAWSLRATPEALRRRWFATEGRELVLSPAIRSAVSFEERNIVEDAPDLWQPGAYDVVFCRNVLMYLTEPAMERVLARIAGALVPGGALFLGHAETLRGRCDGFDLRWARGAYFYERRGAGERRASRPTESAPPSAPAAAVDPGWVASWLETVRRAGERIEALTVPRAPEPSAGPSARRTELERALELVRAERYDDALAAVAHVASEVDEPETRLLRAALLAVGGRPDAAEDACRRLLETDPQSAAAHYVLALCHDGAGQQDAALAEYEAAARLDPDFAMPRLRLGVLARRAGEVDRARRELGRAKLLLPREDATRILLFGGGFTLRGLMSLCQGELDGLEALG